VAPVPDIRKEDKRPTTRVSVEFEDDILLWLRSMGRGWQKKLNNMLRWYIAEVEKQDQQSKD
jgi:uncharacterized protein (DUF4415 family)